MHSRTGVMFALALFASSLLVVPSATADPVTFRYQSTTIVNGATEQIVVVFTFDSSLPNGTGSFGISPTNGSYGPWAGTFYCRVRNRIAPGGTIEIFNNTAADAYDFRWQSWTTSAAITGTLLGEQLCFFRVLLADSDATMFSSTVLPTDPTFASGGNFTSGRLHHHNARQCILWNRFRQIRVS